MFPCRRLSNPRACLRLVRKIDETGVRKWSDIGVFRSASHPDGVRPTHIIVGAGSAGCVLANRLTEDPANRVLLLEAGPRDNWWSWKIHMPAALMYNLRGTRYNWFYHTEPQRHLNDRVLYWPRGRVWGGSSSLNAMVYIRGHPSDYDRWESEGAKGWSYRNCLPYFKRAQTHDLSTGPEDPYRGCAGPLYVAQGKCANPLHMAFMRAGQEMGAGHTDDMNGYRQEGFGPMDMNIRDGKRCSASAAYLTPILHQRPNLFTTSGIYCTKILFNKQRAIGVEFCRRPVTLELQTYADAAREKVYAEEAVILAGGAINTPQLLMISGIGPARHLKHELHLAVRQDTPGVGSNLQDHLEIHVQQKCTKPITLYNKASWRFPHNMVRIGLQWFLTGKGLGASSHLESGGFARSSESVEHPDIQFHFLPGTVHDDGRVDAKCHAFQVHVGPLRSKSRGTIRLWEANPYRAPQLDPNYMSHEEDWSEFRKCVIMARELFSQKAFDQFRGEELAPGIECQTDEQIDDFVRQKAASAYHPCGTCKMGPASDPMAVVDPESMRVHGFDGLYVVDASVMPSIISGNLHASVVMLAERAADLIRGIGMLPSESPPIWRHAKEKEKGAGGSYSYAQ